MFARALRTRWESYSIQTLTIQKTIDNTAHLPEGSRSADCSNRKGFLAEYYDRYSNQTTGHVSLLEKR